MMKPKDVLTRGAEYLSGFMRDRRGNVAILFGLCAFPFIGLVGAAVDYSMASDLRARLQRATDATGLQLCQLANNLSYSQYYDAAKNKLLPTYLGQQAFDIKAFAVTQDPHRINLTTSAVYNTAIVRILGSSFATMHLEAEAQCQNQQETFEIALVLDNTGSMASSSGSGSKMDALKTAATNFVNRIYGNARTAQAKFSIVPFAAAVKVDPIANRTATWIDQTGTASYHWNFLQGGASAQTYYASYVKNRLDVMSYLKGSVPSWDWSGCLESLPYPFNVRDGVPDAVVPDSFYVPMFSADESGPSGTRTNSYIDDGDGSSGCPTSAADAQLNGQVCKYVLLKNPRIASGWGPNASCTSRALTRLTNDKSVILNEISQMQPAGNTNIHEGTIWGWRTLAPVGKSVFGDGVAYDKPFNHKIMIVMTDGMNVWNPSLNPTLKSQYSAYGFFINPDGSNANNRLPSANANPATSGDTRNAIDALTKEACTNASATGSGKPNVVIYTIGFSVPSDPIDTQGINMLKACAGDPSRAFVANDASGIISVFQKIADDIAGVKLTQ